MSKVGERIKQCREERGMNADQLASVIGKDRSTIFRYEKDEIGNIPLNVISKMASVLDVNPAYLAGLSDDKAPIRQTKPTIQQDDELTEVQNLFSALDQNRKTQALSYLRFLVSETGR